MRPWRPSFDGLRTACGLSGRRRGLRPCACSLFLLLDPPCGSPRAPTSPASPVPPQGAGSRPVRTRSLAGLSPAWRRDRRTSSRTFLSSRRDGSCTPVPPSPLKYGMCSPRGSAPHMCGSSLAATVGTTSCIHIQMLPMISQHLCRFACRAPAVASRMSAPNFKAKRAPTKLQHSCVFGCCASTLRGGGRLPAAPAFAIVVPVPFVVVSGLHCRKHQAFVRFGL